MPARVVAIIQARLGSTRLPGKTLADIGGRPLLEHVVERVLATPGVDDVVLATTASPSDEPLVAWARRFGLPAVRGSEEDVLDRFHDALSAYSADAVMRVTPDCPLLDPDVAAKVVATWRARTPALEYVSNVHPPTFPDGLDTEVVSRHALETAWKEATDPADREHVTPFVWRQPGRFPAATVEAEGNRSRDLSRLRWTVDTAPDLAFVREVHRLLPPGRRGYRMEEVLAVLDQHPELERINAGQARNEGYARSVAAARARAQGARR
jgi:spore coat polysaccharide biosynthesis protein SpsF